MSLADAAVRHRLDEVRPAIAAAFSGMDRELARLGLTGEVAWMAVEAAEFSLDTDPADGRQSLVGIWRDARGGHIGNIVVHADGSFYIEYGVAVPHPHKSGWFVDAITAWGRGDMVKSEPRLLPTL